MQILSFREEVTGFLKSQGIEFAIESILIQFPSKHLDIMLVPLESSIAEHKANTVYLFEDRWRKSPGITSQRILARLGVFTRVHARLCKTVSEENCRELGLSPAEFTQKIRKFLDTYHTYGFLKGQINYALVYKENIVAAAQFMQTYKPRNGSSDLRAYEWTRYASLPDMRIAGGMGKVLEQFVRDVRKEFSEGFEVMSYSDNEWSDGDAYRKLGFRLEGSIPPVTYRIDPKTFNRINPRQWAAMKCNEDYPIIRNLGSRKWIKLFSGF